MRWNQWRKRCILACIGGTVFWGSMAGINTVSAVTAGYMADGGHINSTSNVILYQDANGTYELSDQSASKGKTDNSEAVGNVAAGNLTSGRNRGLPAGIVSESRPFVSMRRSILILYESAIS